MAYRTALITGASSGIGRSISERLALEGTEIVLCARRTPELESVADGIRARGGRARVLTRDVADTERTVAAIRSVDEAIGGLDLVLANAGIGVAIHGTRLTWERARDALQVNFNGAVATLCAVLPRMVERRRGHLVGMSSIAALAPCPTGAPYCGSKAGLTTFLESLRLDLEGTGVGVTCIHPGMVRTPMTAYVKKDAPFALGAAEAAEIIVGRLRDRPALIDFPLPMTFTLRSIAVLPRPLRNAALHRFPIPDETC